MNILHMKYAVEVAKAGSLSKAANALLIAQPNLSRSIKELEASLGITIFDRTAKGMALTLEGKEFIGYAQKILNQIEEVEAMYKVGLPTKQRFSISVPRASYISDAFAHFSRNISADPAEIFYNETNSLHAINNILTSDYKLGIVRYAESYDKYFKSLFEEKGLETELVTEFHFVLIMRKDSTLASQEAIHLSDLESYIELAHADPFVPSLPLSAVKKEELTNNASRRIFVYERAGQFDILSENKEAFMWVSPIPSKLLERFDLVQRECIDNKKIYKDVLIYRKDYHLSKLDLRFMEELFKSKEQYL